MNEVILIGRLAREPELRYTQNHTAVSKFTLAVNRRVKKDQEQKADFIDIVTFNKQAEACSTYLNKGKLVSVVGRLQIDSYEDSQGIRRKACTVVANNVRFLERKNDGNNSMKDTENQNGDTTYDEEDIPF